MTVLEENKDVPTSIKTHQDTKNVCYSVSVLGRDMGTVKHTPYSKEIQKCLVKVFHC